MRGAPGGSLELAGSRVWGFEGRELGGWGIPRPHTSSWVGTVGSLAIPTFEAAQSTIEIG